MPGATQPRSDLDGPRPCDHLSGARSITPHSAECLECLDRGCGWVGLWLCLSCGWVACSDDSPNQHAKRTIKRLTIPSPSRWSMTLASAGAMSISAPSDTLIRWSGGGGVAVADDGGRHGDEQ